jgi:hypothetical protein
MSSLNYTEMNLLLGCTMVYPISGVLKKVSYEGQKPLERSFAAISPGHNMDVPIFSRNQWEIWEVQCYYVRLENLVRLPRPPVTRLKAWSRVMAR